MYCSWIACPIGLCCTYVGVVNLQLGLVGAAASATVRDMVQLILLAAGSWKFCPEFRACWQHGFFDKRALHEWPPFLKLGFASLIICCVTWWSWDAATVLCSRLPKDSTAMLATQTVVVNIVSLVYLAPGAVARGASALVGGALGANDADRAKCAFHASIFAAIVVVIAQCVFLYCFRHQVGYLFTDDAEVVSHVAAILAPWGLAFASAGGIQCGLSGVVEGVCRNCRLPCTLRYLKSCPFHHENCLAYALLRAAGPPADCGANRCGSVLGNRASSRLRAGLHLRLWTARDMGWDGRRCVLTLRLPSRDMVCL